MTPLEGLAEASPGLAVDLLDRGVEDREGLFQVGMLRIEVTLAFRLLFVLLDGGEIDGAEPGDPALHQLELLGPDADPGIDSDAREQGIEGLPASVEAFLHGLAQNQRLLALHTKPLQRLTLSLHLRHVPLPLFVGAAYQSLDRLDLGPRLAHHRFERRAPGELLVESLRRPRERRLGLLESITQPPQAFLELFEPALIPSARLLRRAEARTRAFDAHLQGMRLVVQPLPSFAGESELLAPCASPIFAARPFDGQTRQLVRRLLQVLVRRRELLALRPDPGDDVRELGGQLGRTLRRPVRGSGTGRQVRAHRGATAIAFVEAALDGGVCFLGAAKRRGELTDHARVVLLLLARTFDLSTQCFERLLAFEHAVLLGATSPDMEPGRAQPHTLRG